MNEGDTKNEEIKKLIIGINVIFKQIDILFKSVQNENKQTINVFRSSMFSNIIILI